MSAQTSRTRAVRGSRRGLQKPGGTREKSIWSNWDQQGTFTGFSKRGAKPLSMVQGSDSQSLTGPRTSWRGCYVCRWLILTPHHSAAGRGEGAGLWWERGPSILNKPPLPLPVCSGYRCTRSCRSTPIHVGGGMADHSLRLLCY